MRTIEEPKFLSEGSKSGDEDGDLIARMEAKVNKYMNELTEFWGEDIEVAAISHQWFSVDYLSVYVAFKRKTAPVVALPEELKRTLTQIGSSAQEETPE
jgi:hypothetical protein